MTDDAKTITLFIQETQQSLKDTPSDASAAIVESTLQKLRFFFPDTFSKLEKEGILHKLDNPKELQNHLQTFFDEQLQKRKEGQSPDYIEQASPSLSDSDIAHRVNAFKEASAHASGVINESPVKKEYDRAGVEYARELARNFPEAVKNALKKQQELSKQQEELSAVSEKITQKADKVTRPQDVWEELRNATISAQAKKEIREQAELAAQNKQAFDRAQEQYKRTTETLAKAKETAILYDTIVEPTHFFEQSIKRAQTTTEPIETVVKTTEASSWIESVSKGTLDTSQIQTATGELFTTIGGPSKANIRADKEFSKLSPEKQATVVQNVVVHSIEQAESIVSEKTQGAFKRISTSELVRDAIREGNGRIGMGGSAGSAAGDVVSSMFSHATVDRSVVSAIQQSAAAGSFSWMNSQTMYALLMRNQFSIARGVTGKFVASQIVKGAAQEGTAKGLAKLVAGLISTPLPPIVSQIVSSAIVDRVFRWGGRVVEFFSSGGGITKLFEGKSDVDSLILPFVIIGAILVMTFFTVFAEGARLTPFVAGLEGIGIGGTPIDCSTEPDKSSPACNLTKCEVKKEGDCQWPLDKSTGACIIEGPFVGTHSSCKLSGIDFITLGDQDKLFGAQVFTPYAGTVESAVFGYDDYSGYAGNQDGGTYGNHVVVKTTDGGRLMFAHLRNIQTVKTGDAVQARDVVGYVDDTGYSLGVHLHYEEKGTDGCPRTGADINKYTPFPVPPCVDYADCDAQLKAAGYAACLSEMP